ncbi:cilia- and flagella-associated protein 157 [Maniola hyperantus]|uniref:cilia- and flagella-associated protein 157 n=1 Tax=Aphantopus hyperantus TaxID=2795564 RepID=UPI0015696431|nr:cilia- and flagella-associated protein 157 [Maniola hyperantus]
MAPKKDKNKPKVEDKTAAVTEVERTFLELQIAECNRKIARLRTAVDEYEVRNEELQKAYDKLDEDRADIIAYLKKTLNLKNEENAELKEKVRGLEETREIETAQFKETVTELERNFMVMKDQLTSENKLLAGKLNTLEEFRAIRDDLMRKFEKQEQDFKDQEMKYKRIIYDAEKKFVIGKDKLKKEMEGRLLQLAQDFQDATELRIAASTHRVIRENIAINNELDSILTTQAKLADQNEKYKESERAARIAMELAEEERDKAINKNVVQLKVIDQLTAAFQNIRKEKGIFEKKNYDFDIQQAKIQKLVKENENLTLQVRILEQNLHARMCDQNKASMEATKVFKECAKLKKILREAGIAVQAALKLDKWASKDPTKEIMDRQALLSRLLDIITQYREIQQAESIDTLASLGRVYEEGDLGFIPKPTKRKSMLSPSVSVTSKESAKEEKRVSEVSMVSSTFESIKTIPSITLVPPSTEPPAAATGSIASFATSTKSSVSSSENETQEVVPESEMSIRQKLEASKLEIQKSILKDLQYSQMALESQAKMASKIHVSKSVIIEEPGGVVEKEQKEDEVDIEQKEDEVEEEQKESKVEGEQKEEQKPEDEQIESKEKEEKGEDADKVHESTEG